MENGNIGNNDVSNAEPSLVFIHKRQSRPSDKTWLVVKLWNRPLYCCVWNEVVSTLVFLVSGVIYQYYLRIFPFTLKHLTGSFSQCVAERNGFIYKHRLRIASFLERRPSAQGAVFIQIVRLAVNANYTTDLLS